MKTSRSVTSLRCARFAVHLLTALGLAACGNAKDEGEVDPEGQGLTACEGGPSVATLSPGSGQSAQLCVGEEGAACAGADDEELVTRLQSALGGIDFEACDCDCYASLVETTCGAKTMTGECCYDVVVDVGEHCGKGRDLIIDGQLRTASPSSRADWLQSLVGSEAAMPSAAACRLLADAWTRDGLLEHASVAAFARFTVEALAVGAPADLVRAAQVAAADEVRHAEMCFALATRYAGAAVGPGELRLGRQLELRESLAEIAAASVIEGCIGETLAAFRALAARDRASDPAVRRMLARVGRDELTHAELSWRLVAWAIRQGGPTVAQAVADAFDQGERMARATRAALTAARQAEDDAVLAELEAHGRLSRRADVMVRDEVWSQIIRPAMRELLSESIRRDAAISISAA